MRQSKPCVNPPQSSLTSNGEPRKLPLQQAATQSVTKSPTSHSKTPEVLFIIKDGGGNQLTTDQLLTGRVTLDIRHPDPAIAETSARTVSNLIREWDYLPDPVWVTSAGVPTYDPIDDPATPAWTFTAALTVKSTTTRAISANS